METIDLAKFDKLIQGELVRISTALYTKELIYETDGLSEGIQEKINIILRSSLIYHESLKDIKAFPFVIFDENTGVNSSWRSHIFDIGNNELDSILREIGIGGITEYYTIKMQLIRDKLAMINEDFLLATNGSRLFLMNISSMASSIK